MKLIAESGSARTEWSLIDDKKVVEHLFTSGLNPFFQVRRDISRSIRLELPPAIFHKKIEKVYFYGAGCSSIERKLVVSAALITQFRTHTQVESDMLGAARGLLLDKPGIACILDSGSNTCFYNGKEIDYNIASGGYILGDEGSGAAIGKAFLSDVIKNLAPEELIREFLTKFCITPENILEAVYSRPMPGRFLHSVSEFLANYKNNEYVTDTITNSFRGLFKRCITHYDYTNYPLCLTGTTAKTFQTLLKNVASEYGVQISKIEDTPMKGLVQYHLMNKDV